MQNIKIRVMDENSKPIYKDKGEPTSLLYDLCEFLVEKGLFKDDEQRFSRK